MLVADQKEPTLSGSLGIRGIQDLLAGKDMVQELHRHDFFFVLALEKGSGSHVIDFTSYEVGSNTVFFMRPGQVHQMVLKAGSTGYLMQFKSDFYYAREKAHSQLLRKAGSINCYQFDAITFKKILSTLHSIFQEYTEKSDGHQEVINANLVILFIELVRQQNNSTNRVSLYAQERLEKFLDLLERHITSHKSVSQYADMLNITPYQLNAITKSSLGKTCSEVINEHIILESKRFLLATSDQINEVADHLGYADVSYFIRFFKKHTGHSPESFRNNFR
jgi:YesN/AraC family two-component response regulator